MNVARRLHKLAKKADQIVEAGSCNGKINRGFRLVVDNESASNFRFRSRGVATNFHYIIPKLHNKLRIMSFRV